jgi:hypothetical protein
MTDHVGRTLLCAAFEIDVGFEFFDPKIDSRSEAKSRSTSKAADKSVRPTPTPDYLLHSFFCANFGARLPDALPLQSREIPIGAPGTGTG